MRLRGIFSFSRTYSAALDLSSSAFRISVPFESVAAYGTATASRVGYFGYDAASGPTLDLSGVYPTIPVDVTSEWSDSGGTSAYYTATATISPSRFDGDGYVSQTLGTTPVFSAAYCDGGTISGSFDGATLTASFGFTSTNLSGEGFTSSSYRRTYVGATTSPTLDEIKERIFAATRSTVAAWFAAAEAYISATVEVTATRRDFRNLNASTGEPWPDDAIAAEAIGETV